MVSISTLPGIFDEKVGPFPEVDNGDLQNTILRAVLGKKWLPFSKKFHMEVPSPLSHSNDKISRRKLIVRKLFLSQNKKKHMLEVFNQLDPGFVSFECGSVLIYSIGKEPTQYYRAVGSNQKVVQASQTKVQLGAWGPVNLLAGPGQSPGGGSGGEAPESSEHYAFYTLLKHCFRKAFSPILLSKLRIGTT